MKLVIPLLCAAALAAAPRQSAAEEVYRWVDDNGNVYYSDAEPLDVASDRVVIEPPDPEGAMIERAAPEVAVSLPPPVPVRLETAGLGPCALARQQLTLLHANIAIYRDDDGLWQSGRQQNTRSWLADASRPNAIRSARSNVLSACSNPNDVAEELGQE